MAELLGTWLLLVVFLNFMLVVHELGHVAVASLLGLKTTVLGLGLPIGPALAFKVKDVEFRVHAILFGAYAVVPEMNRFACVNDEDSSESTHKRQERLGKRLLVILAGPVSFLVFAWFVMTCSYAFCGIPNKAVKVHDLVPSNPIAKIAGVLPEDKIESIDGVSTRSPEDVISLLQAHRQVPAKVVVVREGKRIPLEMTPNDGGKVGMSLEWALDGYTSVGPGEALIAAAGDTTTLSRAIAQTIPYVLQASLGALQANDQSRAVDAGIAVSMTGYPLLGICGIPGLVNLTYKVITEDWRQIASLFTMISIDLALLNLLPLPGLDGGHFVATVIDAVRKKPGKERKTIRIVRILFQTLMVTAGCPLCMLSGWRTRQMENSGDMQK